MTIEDLKSAYNVLIEREKKAEICFKNPKVTQAKLEAWIPEFNNITILLSTLMIKYKEITGHEMKDSEVLNGFN